MQVSQRDHNESGILENTKSYHYIIISLNWQTMKEI